MDNVLYAEQKVMIFQNLLRVDNKEALNQIDVLINKFLSELTPPTITKTVSDQEVQKIEEKLEDLKEDEDEIFEEDIDETIFLHDFNLTVGELRKQVRVEEKGEKMTKEEFFKSYKEWRKTKDEL